MAFGSEVESQIFNSDGHLFYHKRQKLATAYYGVAIKVVRDGNRPLLFVIIGFDEGLAPDYEVEPNESGLVNTLSPDYGVESGN